MIDASEAVRLVQIHGGFKPASRASGISETTLRRRYHAANVGAPKGASSAPELEIEYPNLPSSELPAEELIEQACARFATRLAAREARRWFEIKIKNNKPIGVVFMGDPHIDNKGTNWPLLREHVRLLETTPGMYAIGGNDITDNWIGRLVRLYADAEMPRKQACKLVKWLLKDSKVKWLCHVLGNHDLWGDMPWLFRANAAPMVPVDDWQARFQLAFPNGRSIRVHMAHDFPGHSQWNNLHGAQKMAMQGEEAHIYACAHKHCWAAHHEENSHRGFVYWLLRSRGYKFIDDYADQHGFGNQRYGASITAVIDPNANGPSAIQCFPDVAEAAEYLTWKRSRA